MVLSIIVFCCYFTTYVFILFLQFQRITFGYGNTTGVEVLRRYLAYIRGRAWLYPGEGGAILKKAKAAMDYLAFLNLSTDKDDAVEPFFNILNQLLKSEYAVLDQQVCIKTLFIKNL